MWSKKALTANLEMKRAGQITVSNENNNIKKFEV